MTPQQIEAIKMALEALKWANKEINEWREDAYGYDAKDQPTIMSAVNAINEALAQPEQEPVAWFSPSGNLYKTRFHATANGEQVVTPLYTNPPHRKPLTDEQIWKFWWSRPEVPDGEDDSMEAEFVAAVRRVLAAHGIKENT